MIQQGETHVHPSFEVLKLAVTYTNTRQNAENAENEQLLHLKVWKLDMTPSTSQLYWKLKHVQYRYGIREFCILMPFHVHFDLSQTQCFVKCLNADIPNNLPIFKTVVYIYISI